MRECRGGEPPVKKSVCRCGQCGDEIYEGEVATIGRYGEALHNDCICSYLECNYSISELLNLLGLGKREMQRRDGERIF